MYHVYSQLVVYPICYVVDFSYQECVFDLKKQSWWTTSFLMCHMHLVMFIQF